MANRQKSEFQLTFPENQKKDANLSTTTPLTFDSLGDFIEERKRISRALETHLTTELRVDYSDFANHVFFDSAIQKFNIAKDRVLTKYPFNGTNEEKDAFHLTGSGYDKYVFDQWPKFVGYAEFDGTTQFISASDPENTLLLGSSSLYVSAWTNPVITEENMILQKTIKHDNYITYSDDFAGTTWTKVGTSISASSIAGPVGVSGSTLVEDSATSTHGVTLSLGGGGLVVDNTYNLSVWVKAANRSRIRIDAGSHIEVSFNFGTGTVTTIGGSDAALVVSTNIESFDSEWFRCSVSWVSSATAAAAFEVYALDDSGTQTYAGLSQDALYIFGAQFSRAPIVNPPPYLRVSGTVAEERSGYEMYFSGAVDPHLKFDIFSGSTTVSVSASYTGFTGSFHNVAAIYDNASDLASLYVDGTNKVSSSAVLGAVTDPSFRLLIGSGNLQEIAVSPVRVFDYYSGSIDEVRIAHTASQLFHEKNFSRPIHAGGEFVTGSDKELDYLKVHYPFNEGVVGTASIDQNIIDYSQHSLHGKFLNYSSAARVSGAVMLSDPGNPILYSFHSGVAAFTSSAEIAATIYDNNNNNFIFNMIPEQLLIEDENADGLLSAFTLGMARFFDEMKLFVDQFDNLRITNYDSFDETPDLFLPMLQRYFGWKVTEHYGEANPLSFFFGENILTSGSTGDSLINIRNQFWRRILNNLPYLYKTKGKRHNLDAFFNVLGINRSNINLKEYGYLPGGSIQDDRILKDKPVAFLGIGTGSFGTTSGSFVSVASASLHSLGAPSTEFSVECMVQLPFVSASFSGTLLSGALWQFDNSQHVFAATLPAGAVTGSHRCYWTRESLLSETGKIVLEYSGALAGFGTGSIFSSSDLSIFNGDFIHVAAGLNTVNEPFISLRGVDGGETTLSEDFTGSAVFMTSLNSNQDFIVGANTASIMFDEALQTQGFFGEVRFWDRTLSGSELDDHALHFESIGIFDSTEEPNPLIGHWALSEENVSSAAGVILDITDLSRNGRTATGSAFPASENAYQRFVREYSHLSPSIDLKWTENKVRVRNKTELLFDDIAHDTNEVSLEFNLVDSLNEDISKIFSTFDVINNLVGSPVNKYRDEYQDLESLSRVYFQRLGDSVNFTRFFDLFRWFDKKLSDSIKQLLPTRVKFIGGEQVVESHFLERNRYGYKYPVFRTPKDPQEGEIDMVPTLEVSRFSQLSVDTVSPERVTDERDTIVASVSADTQKRFVNQFGDGGERNYKNSLQGEGGSSKFFPIKVSGDESESVNNSDSSVNFKNSFARKLQLVKDRDNE